jgi:hypothetical protein
MVRLISGLFSLFVFSSATNAMPLQDGAPYSLPNTYVHQISAPKLNRDYQIFVTCLRDIRSMARSCQ